MADKFKIKRMDGRSNQQVILDYVKDKEAGHVFSYEELIDELNKGTNHAYKRTELQGIILNTYARMLKEQARTLHNVKHVGYRLAPGSYHVTLSNQRNDKADRQLLKGLQVLQNVRWDEMDANQRMAHEAQLLISGALYRQVAAIERRQSAIEDAISKTRSPV
jgi:hypothetical protein